MSVQQTEAIAVALYLSVVALERMTVGWIGWEVHTIFIFRRVKVNVYSGICLAAGNLP
jgi:hypothetical protein